MLDRESCYSVDNNMRINLLVRNRAGHVITHPCLDLSDAEDLAFKCFEAGETPLSIEIDGKRAFSETDLRQIVRELQPV